jgi:hypothetical protein
MKASEYVMCVSNTATELSEEVTKYLSEGWELYGTPMISETTYKDADGDDQTSFACAQSLIKP